ncbi:MAG: sulfite exporter TauE/SafE family protein [Acidimicrobiia bacterium]
MEVSGGELALCLMVVSLGAFVQGSLGFGLNLIVAPVVAVLVPDAVPGGVVLLALPLTIYMVLREHRHIDRRGVAWVMVGRLPGAVIGAAIVVLVTPDLLTSVIGVAILVAVALSAVHPHLRVTPGTASAAGLTAGVMGTAAAIDGPPLALLYQNHRSESIRATLATCFVLGALMSTVALIIAGELRMEQVVFTLVLLPALGVGLLASTWGARHLDGRSLRPAVLTFAAIAGAAALIRGLT